ncbi:MAG: DUF433 domain-containing protein [Candidatus Hydrothermia bacterium]
MYLDEKGIAWIEGTGIKVIEIVRDYIIDKMSPEDIKEAFPELSLAQIFSALAYYYEHKEEFDKQIEEWENYIEILRNQYPKNKIYFKLKEKGLI